MQQEILARPDVPVQQMALSLRGGLAVVLAEADHGYDAFRLKRSVNPV